MVIPCDVFAWMICTVHRTQNRNPEAQPSDSQWRSKPLMNLSRGASIAQKALKRSATDKFAEWDFEQYL